MSEGRNPESPASADTPESDESKDRSFTDEQLREAWVEFAATRKVYQAEYHLLTQEYEIANHQVVVHLHNPIQETLLDTLKTDITAFLREKLKNRSIQVIGELKESDEKKVMYTNREKFEHLVGKNPALQQLKDRLGLDPDF